MMIENPISGWIADAGGPKAVARASENYPKRVTDRGVYKWPAKGIPQWHWPVMMHLVRGLTEAELFAANQAARATKQQLHRRKRRRSKRVEVRHVA